MNNVKELDKETMDEFHKAYSFLSTHPIYTSTDMRPSFQGMPSFYKFRRNTTVEVVKVNPMTGQIDDNPDLNTKTDVWLESGPVLDDNNEVTHDIDLDCGADTYEEAIIELAKLVKEKYGDYEIYNMKDFYRIRDKVNEKTPEEVIKELEKDLRSINIYLSDLDERINVIYSNSGKYRIPHDIIKEYNNTEEKKKNIEKKIENLKEQQEQQ